MLAMIMSKNCCLDSISDDLDEHLKSSSDVESRVYIIMMNSFYNTVHSVEALRNLRVNKELTQIHYVYS